MRFCSIWAISALFFAHTSQAFVANEPQFSEKATDYIMQFDHAPKLGLQNAPSVAEPLTLGSQNTLLKHLIPAPEKDWAYLREQTYTVLALSVATAGLMTFLPESITRWDAEDRSISNLASKWVENVKEGPVWDSDEHYLNYVMHPYFGGVYYIAARHAGFNEFESFLYSFVLSTFFWEYGVESFAEVPSIQDIIVTPFFGALVGEIMYAKEQEIIARGGDVFGSKMLGKTALFFLNPIGHIHHWATDWWSGESSLSVKYNPWFDDQQAAKFVHEAGANYSDDFIGLQLKFKF